MGPDDEEAWQKFLQSHDEPDPERGMWDADEELKFYARVRQFGLALVVLLTILSIGITVGFIVHS